MTAFLIYYRSCKQHFLRWILLLNFDEFSIFRLSHVGYANVNWLAALFVHVSSTFGQLKFCSCICLRQHSATAKYLSPFWLCCYAVQCCLVHNLAKKMACGMLLCKGWRRVESRGATRGNEKRWEICLWRLLYVEVISIRRQMYVNGNNSVILFTLLSRFHSPWKRLNHNIVCLEKPRILMCI